ncbi:MAG TPA: L-threonylcarbamoyladenylate synthase [Planctomycetota bacterium]|nr:L-threonylcarbamoyladenylate synthase [Planctomycetota bacterium]
MKTRILRLDGSHGDDAKIRSAARAVREGRLVAFPTETVYGLGTNADDPAAMRRLSDVKQREPGKPFAIMIPDHGHIERYVKCDVSPLVCKLTRLFWPGPLTIVVPLPSGGTVGLRLPDHPVARALVAWAECPVAVPSANPAGAEPPLDAESVLRSLGGKIDVLLDGGPVKHGQASTVALARDSGVEVLRDGPITQAELSEASRYTILFVCSGNSCRSPMAEGFLKKILAVRGGNRLAGTRGRIYHVLSAGTGLIREGEVNPLALEVMAEAGVDISAHRSRPLSVGLIAAADRIYTMTERQRTSILEMVPEAAERTELLDPSGDLLDPAGSDIAAYRDCRDRIAVLVERVAQHT